MKLVFTGIHPELDPSAWTYEIQNKLWAECIEAFCGSGAACPVLLAGEIGLDVRMAKRAGLLHDIGKSIDHDDGRIPYSDWIWIFAENTKNPRS